VFHAGFGDEEEGRTFFFASPSKPRLHSAAENALQEEGGCQRAFSGGRVQRAEDVSPTHPFLCTSLECRRRAGAKGGGRVGLTFFF
jgi:hypothetical protein